MLFVSSPISYLNRSTYIGIFRTTANNEDSFDFTCFVYHSLENPIIASRILFSLDMLDCSGERVISRKNVSASSVFLRPEQIPTTNTVIFNSSLLPKMKDSTTDFHIKIELQEKSVSVFYPFGS